MSFNETLSQLQAIYHDTERQFLEFTEIIPLVDNPWYVYSPRLYGLLHLINAQVEALFPIICKKLNVDPKNADMNGWYEAINNGGVLENYKVVLEKNKLIIQPFAIKVTQPLRGKNFIFGWWFAYIGSKHGFPEGIKFATVGNVLHSLAATYVLHRIAYFSQFNDSVDLLNPSNWQDEKKDLLDNPILLRSINYSQEIIRSEFFLNFRKFWLPKHGADIG